MKAIFNEYKYAEELLIKGFSRFMSLQDLTILAKYYKYKGFSSTKIKKELNSFCETFNLEYNEVLHGGYVRTAIRNANKYPLRFPEEIWLTENELKQISELKDYKLEKIIFVMMILAKFYKKMGKNKKFYYLNTKFTEILKLSKVNINKEQRYYIQNYLYKQGYYEATYFGTFKMNCLDVDNNASGSLLINIGEDIINQYSKYKKDRNIGIRVCECGQTFTPKSNRQKYCEECKIKKYKNIIKQKNKRCWLKKNNNS